MRHLSADSQFKAALNKKRNYVNKWRIGMRRDRVTMTHWPEALCDAYLGMYVGESAHITHSAQSRTNVRKSLIICNMTSRETSCGYHRIPSTVRLDLTPS